MQVPKFADRRIKPERDGLGIEPLDLPEKRSISNPLDPGNLLTIKRRNDEQPPTTLILFPDDAIYVIGIAVNYPDDFVGYVWHAVIGH
ncbi:hypothetical protein SBC2_28910 [Caballeronia sp. SBC2]|nr:hypothetical protein SBC2_28910 [Caballeronia sp. SBC2]